jgi:poly(A) polymerase
VPSNSETLKTLFSPLVAPQLEFSRRLATTFREADYELFLVGGAIRDALLGVASDELDFATSAPPADTAELLTAFGRRSPYRVGEKFGTIGINVEGRTVEVTTFRTQEIYSPGSRKPTVCFGQTIEEDLARRDFSINALAFDPLSGRLIDPFYGVNDLNNRILRAVGDRNQRFQEDPLRLLRAVRFAARLRLQIEDATSAAMRNQAPALESISRERIRDEYTRFLEGDHAVAALTLMREFGLFGYSVPQLDELTRMPDHGPSHPLSLWDHTMRVVAAVPTDHLARWAALLHDIAKPATRTREPDGRTRFFHHEIQGAEMSRRIMTSLRYPTSEVETVTLLVATHMQLHAYSPEWSDGAVRRLCLRLGHHVESALALARADAAGHSDDGSSNNSPKFDALERRLQQLGSEQVRTMKSPLSGRDLMQHYSRPAGPWVGKVKDRLLEEVLDGKLRQDDAASAWSIADRVLEDG